MVASNGTAVCVLHKHSCWFRFYVPQRSALLQTAASDPGLPKANVFVSGVPFRNAVEGTPETKTETSDDGRTASGAERGKDRDRLGAEWRRLAGAWRGPCKWSDQSRPVSVCRFGAEARVIVFREAETGSRAARRRGANPAKRDCAGKRW